jgi:hypothetical protein
LDITSFLADSEFYTNNILAILKKYNVKPIIAKNVKIKNLIRNISTKMEKEENLLTKKE